MGQKAALGRLLGSDGSGGIFIDTLHFKRGKATTAGRIEDWDRMGLSGGSEMGFQGAQEMRGVPWRTQPLDRTPSARGSRGLGDVVELCDSIFEQAYVQAWVDHVVIGPMYEASARHCSVMSIIYELVIIIININLYIYI